jgi:hypothetical protein
MAPTIEPMMPDAWNAPSSRSFPNNAHPMNPPTKLPMTPRTSVSPIDIGSLPGTSARAMKPAIRPTTISPMMNPITFVLLRWLHTNVTNHAQLMLSGKPACRGSANRSRGAHSQMTGCKWRAETADG